LDARCERVAVFIPRSPDAIVGILAALLAGAAYVPIDPEYPAARALAVITDCGPRIALGRRDDLQRLGTLPPGCVGLAVEGWPTHTPDDGRGGPESDDVAYVMYTSGSTGQPKGVVIRWRSLENYLRWCDEALPHSGFGAPVFGSLAFDHSVTSLYPVLRWGEPAILLPPLEGGRTLAGALLTGRRYSYAKITPSHLRLLDPDGRAALGRACDLVMFGGERLTGDLVAQVRRDRPDLPVINHYGPTETTVGCCVHRVPPGVTSGPVPIGRAIPGMFTRVRRPDFTPCGPGEAGELFLAGEGLFAGYLGRSDLTDAALVQLPDELSPIWYRTGDLVSESGDITCLGRFDRQVKILGNRIEPAEVEALLREAPGVHDVAVFVTETATGPELVAALVAEANVDLDAVRGFARANLPAPQVPARFAVFDRLPVTVHGKLDEDKVRECIAERAVSAASAHPLEELCALLRELLALDQVGPDDDFFDVLGGDSMVSMSVLRWIHTRWKVELELSAIFEHPTPRELAALVHAMTSGNA
jgi:amino acid adenylation domain-containing protein